MNFQFGCKKHPWVIHSSIQLYEVDYNALMYLDWREWKTNGVVMWLLVEKQMHENYSLMMVLLMMARINY